jgi:DNA (cytosine-5)-methyltransferase 1
VRVGSLFSGIGGFDLGLERAGMEIAWQVEIDPYANRVLARHWPDVERWEDVRTFPPAGDWSVDLICGGFPCVDISNSQTAQTPNRESVLEGLDGEESGLWHDMFRVVRQLRPRFVLIENSSALLVRGLDRILCDLASERYDAEWSVISAASMGAPHLRRRCYILGYRDMEDADSEGLEGDEFRFLAEPRDWRQHADSGRSAWWHTPPGVRVVGDGVSGVVVQRREKLTAAGNAVLPQVVEWIGRQIMEAGVV